MNLEEDRSRINTITDAIIRCSHKVSNELGVGFLEKVYENALAHELKKAQHYVVQQKPIEVYYDKFQVGHYMADLVVDETVLVELKVCKAFEDVHLAQCLNYLRSTGFSICLLLNFGNPKSSSKAHRPQFLAVTE